MPSLNDYVDHKYDHRDQRATVKRVLGTKSRGVAGYMDQVRTDAECEALWGQVVLRSNTHDQFHFVEFEQARVDELAPCLGYVRDMLRAAQPGVGEHFGWSNSKYENFFGSRAWFGVSATKRAGIAAGTGALSGYESRSAFVRTMFTDLLAAYARTWVLVRSIVPRDAASLSTPGHYQISIGPGFPRGRPGHLHAGVLIHEMGHNLGLVDVCSVCQRTQLDNAAHFVNHVGLTCDDNATHGDEGPGGNGHFIGEARCKTLASEYKNMSVFNTDSYRLYCCAYYDAEVKAELARHQALKKAEDDALKARRVAFAAEQARQGQRRR
jgi:hypothetical protein